MEKKPRTKENEGRTPLEREQQKRKLSRPPKDNREVIIGPTVGTGTDITVQ